ncbi:hypothetical protein, partial [Moorena sp. SIO2C4]|uniref:hypothetical protein n=1 Tax=Moorena sp. SIO2C4 TaxID=2607824 RepID=UPI0013CDC5B4
RVQPSTPPWPKATRSRSTLAKGHAIAFNIQPKLGQRPRDRIQPSTPPSTFNPTFNLRCLFT